MHWRAGEGHMGAKVLSTKRATPMDEEGIMPTKIPTPCMGLKVVSWKCKMQGR